MSENTYGYAIFNEDDTAVIENGCAPNKDLGRVVRDAQALADGFKKNYRVREVVMVVIGEPDEFITVKPDPTMPPTSGA